jgi:hypothetical protein
MGSTNKGSYITCKTVSKEVFKGELISCGEDFLVIGKYDEENIVLKEYFKINTLFIDKYSVRFANGGSKHSKIGAIMSGATILHGFWLIFTLPINLIHNHIVINSEENDVIYSEKEIDIAQLHKYSRFPQGLPTGYLENKKVIKVR